MASNFPISMFRHALECVVGLQPPPIKSDGCLRFVVRSQAAMVFSPFREYAVQLDPPKVDLRRIQLSFVSTSMSSPSSGCLAFFLASRRSTNVRASAQTSWSMPLPVVSLLRALSQLLSSGPFPPNLDSSLCTAVSPRLLSRMASPGGTNPASSSAYTLRRRRTSIFES